MFRRRTVRDIGIYPAHIYISDVFQQGWRLMCSQKFCTKYILSTLGPCCLQLFSRTGKVTLEPENGGTGQEFNCSWANHVDRR